MWGGLDHAAPSTSRAGSGERPNNTTRQYATAWDSPCRGLAHPARPSRTSAQVAPFAPLARWPVYSFRQRPSRPHVEIQPPFAHSSLSSQLNAMVVIEELPDDHVDVDGEDAGAGTTVQQPCTGTGETVADSGGHDGAAASGVTPHAAGDSGAAAPPSGGWRPAPGPRPACSLHTLQLLTG